MLDVRSNWWHMYSKNPNSSTEGGEMAPVCTVAAGRLLVYHALTGWLVRLQAQALFCCG